MRKDDVAAFGALRLDDRGQAREAAARFAVRQHLFAHLVNVVDQQERDLGGLRLRHGKRGGEKQECEYGAADNEHDGNSTYRNRERTSMDTLPPLWRKLPRVRCHE